MRHDTPTVLQDDKGSRGGATMEHRHWQGGPVFSGMKGAATITVANSVMCAFGVAGTIA